VLGFDPGSETDWELQLINMIFATALQFHPRCTVVLDEIATSGFGRWIVYAGFLRVNRYGSLLTIKQTFPIRTIIQLKLSVQ
jgi:hypothetical protein